MTDTRGPDADGWRLLDAAEVVVPAADVARTVSRIAGEITAALGDSLPVVLVVMNGGIVFGGHLLTELRFPLEIDYVHVGRYGHATSGGELRWIAEPHLALAGRTVLVVDDILDEGVTLEAIVERCRNAGAARVYTAVLARKTLPQPPLIAPDFVGFDVPNAFVFGFGMDVNGQWRNLPEIRKLPEPAR
jgi:hypoxanthine phosphoribosyltransferase